MAATGASPADTPPTRQALPTRAGGGTPVRAPAGPFAGDLALVFSATGGVFLAGGIVPRIVDVFRGGAFAIASEDKPPVRAAMRAVPRFVMTRPEPGIAGLTARPAAQDRFLFPGRDWRA